MLDITLIVIGKIKSKYLNIGYAEYQKRLKPFAKLHILEIKAESFSSSNKEKAKKIESEKILKALDGLSCKIFLLTEHGSQFDSLSFSNKLDELDGKKIVFVIAGALGFSEEVVKKYPSLSLSPLTFTHEMARVILLEQIYRAICIRKGKEYHY
ncbi:MAG TPA: 23S rRNA (pseudouridine(1915)-N(3))-methyltransferase RlmH [Patescibacteria group bacterium]|nr:23S rRNA (pseudouridine(1915)-N(3))-methyltransferase RlmH [Patescibacteria group bacterium]